MVMVWMINRRANRVELVAIVHIMRAQNKDIVYYALRGLQPRFHLQQVPMLASANLVFTYHQTHLNVRRAHATPLKAVCPMRILAINVLPTVLLTIF